MIQAAIVGLGWWGRQHVESMSTSTRLRYVRAVSKEPAQVREFAGRHQLALGTDYAEVLRDRTIEAVVLCTPHLLHVDQIVAAARAGKHVYCEKPLAMTRQAAQTAVQACRDAGVVLAVGHDKRLNPGYADFKAALQTGLIGPVLSVDVNANRDTVDVSPGSWKTQGDNAGSLGLINYGVHRIDALIDLFGPVKRVYAVRAAGRVPSSPGIDATAVVFEFFGGVIGYLGTVSHSAPFSRIQAFGPEGSILLREWDEVRQSVRGRPDAVHRAETIDTVRENVERFAMAITEGIPFHISAEQIVETASVLEACLASLRMGQPVDVALDASARYR